MDSLVNFLIVSAIVRVNEGMSFTDGIIMRLNARPVFAPILFLFINAENYYAF